MLKLFVLCVVFGVTTAVTPKQCCASNTVLLKIKPPTCWDPKLNTTTAVNGLQCKTKLKFINFSIESDGRLIVRLGKEKTLTIEDKSFCVANQTTAGDADLRNATPATLVCVSESDAPNDQLSGYCLIVSVVFLFITAAIYMGLPELRDLQGKSLISFCWSLGLGMMVLVIMKLMPYRDMKLCAARGFLAYYFILASFFWTNAISIQILLCMKRPTTVSYDWREFVRYAVYAWGVPALLSACMAIVNFVPGSHPKPGIGLNHCWFYDSANQWYYMYSVMSVLIIANVCIFVYTSLTLWRNTFATTRLKALKYKFMMTMRLFVLMGITWIFEMISSAVKAHIIWTILDIYNTLQGLIIFLMLVPFRRRVVKAMYKHGWLDWMSGAVEKHLAVGEDDEQDVVEHTKEVPLEETK